MLGIALGVGGGFVVGACKPSGDDGANGDGTAGTGGAAAGGATPSPRGGAGMVSAGAGSSVSSGVSGGVNDGGPLGEAGTPETDAGDAGDAAPPMTDCTTMPAPKCSITISGLPTGDGTYDCTAPGLAYYTPTGQMLTSVTAGYTGNSIQLAFGPAFPGDIHAATFSSDSAGAAGLVSLIYGESGLMGGTQWLASPANASAPAKGDYALTITCFSKFQMTKAVVYYTVQGSMTAHLLPAVGTGTDIVTVEATF